ncbi:hypothetical protein AB6A40_008892 [Gnathostoma spinigerum]|uniref:Aquaporin n=1 Tax=Gnathostoma spinigerum TaxID=75299 RepID=A0ABD6EYM7_9BILA
MYLPMEQIFQMEYTPLAVSLCFYLTVFAVGEISRRITERFVSHDSNLYFFLIEAVSTAQMCTCVYENAVIIRHYGPLGFFFVVSCIGCMGAILNRGAFASPLKPVEMFYYRSIGVDKFLATLSAQAVGGYAAFRIARHLWYLSLNLATDHAINYNASCAFSYKVSYWIVFSFEILGCFLLRATLVRIPDKMRRIGGPITMAAFLTFALSFIGVPGLNPTVASSRMQGCDGLDLRWFFLTYWICPVIGWMLSAEMENRRLRRIEKTE